MPKEIKSEQEKRRSLKRKRAKSVELHGVDTTWHEPFIEATLQGCLLYEACKRANVSPQTFHAHRKKFPQFDSDYRECRSIAAENLKGCLMDRAINGQEDVTTDPEGKETIRRYVDNKLGMYLLTKLCPEEYGDRQEVQTTQKLVTVTEEELIEQANTGFIGIIRTISASLGADDLPLELRNAVKELDEG